MTVGEQVKVHNREKSNASWKFFDSATLSAIDGDTASVVLASGEERQVPLTDLYSEADALDALLGGVG